MSAVTASITTVFMLVQMASRYYYCGFMFLQQDFPLWNFHTQFLIFNESLFQTFKK